MNWKTFFIGAAIGIIGGYAAKDILSQKLNISPEKALDFVKDRFKKHGPISGSWIHNETEPFKKKLINYRVYKGGISKNENGANKQYEFIVDASTGTILDVHPL